MNYHDITKDDMKNGDGLRVVLWVAGCSHHCKNCHNPITWDPDGGLPFTDDTMKELLDDLDHDYISGLTLSGGDPLQIQKIDTIKKIVMTVKDKFPDKTIWVYTGYTLEHLMDYKSIREVLRYIDVLVDGPFIEELKDINYKWAGSTNQRVIDVKETLYTGRIILHEDYKTENY